MSTTSKSPRKVALVALQVGKDALPAYCHRFGPKVFTQPQLFACLVPKECYKTDYRGIAGILVDTPTVCDTIGLKKLPHWTRLLRARPRGRRSRRTRVKGGAVDSSGLESHHVSEYFVWRRAKGGNSWQSTTYTRFPKLALLCDCSNHLVLAALAVRGPGLDITHFERVVCEAHARARMDALLADAGYDAERVHRVARGDLGIRTIIPPKSSGDVPLHLRCEFAYYRRVMSQRLHLTCYGQRWRVGTTVSMIKRRLGEAVNARSYWSQSRALMLKAIAHNVLILHAPIEPSRHTA